MQHSGWVQALRQSNNPNERLFVKTLIPKLAAALLLAFTLGSIAFAAPFAGNITFSGNVTLTGGTNFATRTGVGTWSNTIVNGADGDFVPLVSQNDTVWFSPNWTFNSGAVAPFWQVQGFQFDLINSVVDFHTANAISVSGTGTLSGNGFDPTNGIWQFSTQNIAVGGKFSFSASSAVPDGSSTVLLLGLGIVGMTLILRRHRLAA